MAKKPSKSFEINSSVAEMMMTDLMSSFKTVCEHADDFLTASQKEVDDTRRQVSWVKYCRARDVGARLFMVSLWLLLGLIESGKSKNRLWGRIEKNIVGRTAHHIVSTSTLAAQATIAQIGGC